MGLFHSDVLCPYCLQELRNKDLQMFCNICDQPITPTAIELFLKRIPKCTNNGCRGFANVRKCGYCGNKLPSDILDYKKYLRFSLLGITGSGKTTFLTTMLHELRHAIKSPWVLSPMDTVTQEIFRQNDNMLYNDAMRTFVNATTVGAPPPQLWKIKDKSKMSGSVIPSYSMTIFDGAGEMAEHIDPVISRYIEGSKALIILFDPLVLPSVASSISKDILGWSTTTTHDANATTDMVDGLANYVRQSCGISPGKLIDRDVAVVFTKMDVLRDIFGSATVTQPSPHLERGGFVKADADAVNAEIRDWLEEKGETAFLNAIDTNFQSKRIRFFGVSSFGQPPIGNNKLGRVVPHRVLDPLIWMFAKEGIASIV